MSLLFDFDGDAVRAADARDFGEARFGRAVGFEDFDGDLRFAGIAAVGGQTEPRRFRARRLFEGCGPCFRCRERNGFRSGLISVKDLLQ